MSTQVALINCLRYDQSAVDAAVERALGLIGGPQKFIPPGSRVLLKFNLLAATPPEEAVTTHPAILRAVARQVRLAGGIPVAGDCSGWEGPPNSGRYFAACRKAGLKQVCDEDGIELLHLSAESVEVESPQGRAYKRFTLATAVLSADVVINLPKLKTHALALFTGGVKNLLGCLPGLHKGQMHLRAQKPEAFAQALVDLLAAVRPALTIMDGIVGMEGNGPRNGSPREVGAILASSDPVALDAVACELIGISPFAVHTTRLAHAQGLGVGNLDQIEVLGDTIQALRVAPFLLPSSHSSVFTRFGGRFAADRIVAKPAVKPDRCRACWICVDACPAGALVKDTTKPVFDYDKCIHCYCCQEMCPHDAIALRRPLLTRLLAR